MQHANLTLAPPYDFITQLKSNVYLTRKQKKKDKGITYINTQKLVKQIL